MSGLTSLSVSIVGGSFGLKGRLGVDGENNILVDAARTKRFTAGEVSTVSLRTEKDKKFGCFSFVIGAVILSVIFGLFLSILGVVIGVVLAGAGSFYTNRKNFADIAFVSGESVTVECTERQARRLVQIQS